MIEGWNNSTLGDVGTFQRGGNFLKSDFVDEGFPCLHYGQIHQKLGTITKEHLTCIPYELAIKKAKMAQKGDVILAITSEDVAGSCKCTAWMGDYEIAVGAHTAIFHHSLNPLFVSYYFQSPTFHHEKEQYTHGFKVVEIRPTDIAKIPISYPSPAEQQRIVEVLDAEFAKIDALKANAEKNLQNAKDLFQASLKKELEPKDGWRYISIEDIAELKGGKRVPKGYKLEKEPTSHPYIRVADFNNRGSIDLDDIHYISDEVFNGIKRYIITTDDVYISIAGTIGKSGIIPSVLNGANLTENACRLVFKEKVNNKYIYYCTISLSFREQITALTMQAAQPKLALTRLATARIYIPTLLEQDKIVKTLDSIKEMCEAIQENYTKTIALCDDLKQALLRKAFNGEL